MTDEKRKAPRIDFDLPLTIKGYQGEVQLKDFSLSGLFILVEDVNRFEPGDIINLVLELPFGNKPIAVGVRVMRVTLDGMGVEFVDLHPEDRIAIEECFYLFKDTVPMPEA